MMLLNAFPCVGACGSSVQRLRHENGHILYRQIPAALMLGGLVALLMSAHMLCYCHINMLLFECCQTLVANCVPFVSVPGQFFRNGSCIYLGRLNVVLKRFF